MCQFRAPQYLTGNDQPTDRVRCAVHGFIRFSPNERAIINHWLFQRLRFIRQLALTEYVYPGATHTRFEHSLGVMEVATKAFDAIAQKSGETLEKTFQTVAGFEDEPLAKARQVLRLAALLHDTGHAPFSHAVEHAVHAEGHEELSYRIIQETGFLGELIQSYFGEDIPLRVSQILSGRDIPPQLKVLKDIVSGQMDADRTDYLLRDSHHCGVDYGKFDHLRLLDSIDVLETEGGLEVVLMRDGIHTFEAMILARYQLFTQVLYHRMRRAYDHYLLEYVKALGNSAPKTANDILGENDITMMARIFIDATREGEPQHPWAVRVRDRKHHRVIYDTGMDANARQVARAKRVARELQIMYTDVHIFSDLATGKIHGLMLPEDREEKFTPLYLVRPNQQPVLVTEESHVLRKVLRDFQSVRIFADVESSSELRNEITTKAVEMMRE